tara:strand:- start:1161 stop:1670 length:510 start_codon:yes stop_codon:yes gene_type:complete
MDALISDSFFSFLLIGIGMALIFLEVFIPSGGIIGIVAIFLMGMGIFGFFHQEKPLTGLLCAVGSLVFVITMFFYMLRRITFKGAQDPESFTSVDRGIAEVEGESGVAKTILRPAGVALINGKRIDVVASGGFIEKGRPVKVIETSGNRVVVKELPESRSKPQEQDNDG